MEHYVGPKGKEVKLIHGDIILDNGACIQIMTYSNTENHKILKSQFKKLVKEGYLVKHKFNGCLKYYKYKQSTTMKVEDIPSFTKSNNYCVDISWKYLEDWLANQSGIEYSLNLDPDFQRAHVWDVKRQVKYVEYILRGGKSSKDIYFNHPNWQCSYYGEMVIVDGKQRLEAVRKFMRNELRVFGGYLKSEIEGLTLRSTDCCFKVHVNDLKTRKEVLQWYLDINEGGVAHTEEELVKVRELLMKEGE